MRDGTTAGSWRLRGLGAMAHPVALVALVTLVVHDAFLRPLLPALLAGKVSDVAGLVLFPLVLASLLAAVLRDDDTVLLAATGVTVVWFAAMKLVPVVTERTIALAEVVTPRAQVTPDGTDLLALPAVLAAAWVWRHRVPQRAWASPVLVLAVLWSAATSCGGPAVGYDVVALDDGSFHVDLDGWDVRVEADGTVERDVTGGPPAAVAEDGGPRTEVCLDDGTCVRGDGHDVVEVGPDGTTTTVVDIPEGRFIYAERTVGSCGPSEFVPVRDVAANDRGVVVVAHGSHGVSIRAADGSWTRPDVGGTTFTGPLPVEFPNAVWALALGALLVVLWPGGRLAWLSGTAAAVAVGAAVVPLGAPLLLLAAWPALGLVAVVAVVTMVVAAGRVGSSAVLRAVCTALVAASVGHVLLWAWAAGWIAPLWVAAPAALVALAAPMATLVQRGRAAGTWPVRVAGEGAAPPPDGVA